MKTKNFSLKLQTSPALSVSSTLSVSSALSVLSTITAFSLIFFFTSCNSKSVSKQYSNLQDVVDAGGRIGVVLGTTHDNFVSSNYPIANILHFESNPDLALAVKAGQVDAVVGDQNILKPYLKEDPELAVLEWGLFDQYFGFGFGDVKLRDNFNSYLAMIRESGELDAIKEKWENADDNTKLEKRNFNGNNGILRIGITGVSIPFAYMSQGEYVGIEIELMYGFAEYADMKPEIHTMQFPSLIASIVSKKVDIIGSPVTITEERKKQILFSDCHYISASIAVALRNNCAMKVEQHQGLNLRKTENLKDKRVAVMLGSVQDIYATNNFSEATIFRLNSTTEMVPLLQQSQCDAIFLDDNSASLMLREYPEFIYLDDEVIKSSCSVGFPKSNTKERDEFNVFLKEIRDNGVYDEVYNRWIINGDAAVMPKIDNLGTNGIIRIGSTFESIPFSYLKNNEYCGFDVELMLRFAAFLNKKPKFFEYNFSGLLAAVSTGKVDIIANGIAATEERAEQINFSDVYYTGYSGIIILAKNLAGNNFTENDAQNKTWFTKLKDSFYNNIIKEKRYLLLWNGLKVTFIISVFSAILGTLLGALICWLRMNKNKTLKIIAQVYIDILRGIPQVVLLMLSFYVVFASWKIGGVTVAIIAFAMNFAAYVSEMFRTSIQGVKKGQSEAGIAMGFSKVKSFVNIVMPQAIQRVIPVYKGEFIGLVKMTSIVGYIAVQDLTKASDIIRSRTFDAFFPLIVISIIYFLLTWLLTLLLDAIQIKTAPRRH